MPVADAPGRAGQADAGNPRDTVPCVADVVIAGAGMAGIAAAHHLAVRCRVARVVLVDPREPLSMTSSRGAEAYRNFWPGPDDAMVRLMNRSIDLLDELDRDSGQAFELNRRGYVFLTADPLQAEGLRAHDGPGAEFLEGGIVRTRYPFVTDRAVAMLHVRRAGFLSAMKLGHWMLTRALAHGTACVRDEVTGLVVDHGRVAAVRLASGARIDAGAFVLAAGPLLPEWAGRLEIRVPIVNELHGKISFEDDAGIVPRDAPMLIWNDAVDLPRGTFPAGVHLRPRGTRSLLGIWAYQTRIGTAAFPPAFDSDHADIVLDGLATMIPGLRAYRGRSNEAVVDGGYYCKTPDNRPLVGPTAIDGVHLLGALSGYGVMASQAAAELVAAHLLEQPLPEYAAAFHPARFEDPAYQSTLARLGPASGQL